MLVEQNVRQTLDIADRAYVLANGCTVRSGTSAELLTDDAIQEAYLGLGIWGRLDGSPLRLAD